MSASHEHGASSDTTSDTTSGTSSSTTSGTTGHAHGRSHAQAGRGPAMRSAAIVIASTRAAAGTYEDECGPAIAAWLYEHGYAVADAVVVPDGDAVGQAIGVALEARPAVLITSGGTGLSPDDATPEQTAPYLTRSLPGIMEAIRRAGEAAVPTAVLSRGLAGAAGSTFVINLPGSPGGVRDGLAVLSPLVDHICSQLEGHNDHR